MIVPKRHVETSFDLHSDEWAALPDALAFARNDLSDAAPDGYTVVWNVGRAAGQTVFHAHMHVIARSAPDKAAGLGIWGFMRPVLYGP